eukprot:scaffold148064_cov26-Tisochrysis_lutea.AAC.1
MAGLFKFAGNGLRCPSAPHLNLISTSLFSVTDWPPYALVGGVVQCQSVTHSISKAHGWPRRLASHCVTAQTGHPYACCKCSVMSINYLYRCKSSWVTCRLASHSVISQTGHPIRLLEMRCNVNRLPVGLLQRPELEGCLFCDDIMQQIVQ